MGAWHEIRNSVAAHNVLSGYFNLETWVGRPWEQQLQDNELVGLNIKLKSKNTYLRDSELCLISVEAEHLSACAANL